MARGFVVRFGEEESTFAMSKIDREKLYGRKERLVVDEEGKACSAAYLTADGIALIPWRCGVSLYRRGLRRGGPRRAGRRGRGWCAPVLEALDARSRAGAHRGRGEPTLDHVVTSVYALSQRPLVPTSPPGSRPGPETLQLARGLRRLAAAFLLKSPTAILRS